MIITSVKVQPVNSENSRFFRHKGITIQGEENPTWANTVIVKSGFEYIIVAHENPDRIGEPIGGPLTSVWEPFKGTLTITVD